MSSNNNNNPRNSNNEDDEELSRILRLMARLNIPYRREGSSTLSLDLGFIGSVTDAMLGLVNDTVVSLGGLHVISPAAVEALERFRHDGAAGDAAACPVCLEEFVAGLELTRMPCSHAFHGDCLRKWLEKNDTCPLCRFKLPS